MGAQDDSDSLAAMEAALERGVRHFDTAQVYGGGRSERVCGQFVQGKRDKVYLASKGFPGGHPGSIVEALHGSLRNLGVDHVDLYYLHWPLKGVDMRPYMELLEKERAAGAIGAIGVSNFSVEQMEAVREAGVIDAHQLCYSALWRAAEDDVLPYCARNGIAAVAYSPLAQGILTGKFGRDPQLAADDVRRGSLFFRPDLWPAVHLTVELLQQAAAEAGRPPAHLALQWIRRQGLGREGGIASMVVGARNGRQAREMAAALDTPAPGAALDRVQELSDSVRGWMPKEPNIFGFQP